MATSPKYRGSRSVFSIPLLLLELSCLLFHSAFAYLPLPPLSFALRHPVVFCYVWLVLICECIISCCGGLLCVLLLEQMRVELSMRMMGLWGHCVCLM